MRRDLMDILACPACKGSLALAVQREDDTEIIEGTLTCTECDVIYPIERSIPNLLPADLQA
ncbi:MAG: methytransferase partner Trm112 [Dehalococcoidia bacterium]